MTYLILTIILFAVCAIGFSIGRNMAKDPDETQGYRDTGTALKWGSVGVFILIFGLWTTVRTFHSVPAGHVGVQYQFGNIVGQTGSGLVTIAPWRELKEANVQVQKQTFDNLNSFSKETQDVFITATLNYEVSPGDIQTLYRTVGPGYFDKLVPTRLNQIFKDETVKFAAVNIAPNREVIRKDVRDKLKAALEPYSIQVDDLLIDNIHFSPEFTKAIEDKQIATQQAKAAANRVKTAQAEAAQVIAQAKGQAKAQKLQRSTLTPLLIQKYAIDKLNPEVKVIYLPAGSNFLVPLAGQNAVVPKSK